MHIATVTTGPPNGTGGTDRHLADIVRLLEGDGHQVDCYHCGLLDNARRWSLWDRIGFRSPANGMLLAQRIRAQRCRYDLVFANSHLGAFLPKDNPPVINVYHSVDAAYADACRSGISRREYLYMRYIWAAYEKRSARRHHVVAVSKRIARELGQFYGIKTASVIPYCLDTEAFSPGNQDEARSKLGLPVNHHLLLFAGSWIFRKGVDLINMLAMVLPPDWKLVAASAYFDPSLPVNDRILVLRNVPAHEMLWVYRACDMLVFPTRAEACPFVTKEAMACGLPVVTTTAGTGEELQKHPVLGTWVVDCPPRFESLRNKVMALIMNPMLREYLSKVGRQYIQQSFSIDSFNTNYRELIRRLIPVPTHVR